MRLKKLFPIFLIAISSVVVAQETATKFKFYGFIRNDFFYNTRQNVEAIDGVFHIFPKPIEKDLFSDEDKNELPQAEMLSIASRVGVDITGADMLGAKSSAKIESDYAGFGTSFHVLRIRQAYAKLNWEKTELLVGQTWHPMFGSVMPITMSLNAGAPFQPFNRSPMVRYKQNLTSTVSLTAAAMYQMQYTSQGPLGSSAVYMKNALTPNLFLGAESKTRHWTSGVGVDFKTIKPEKENLYSFSAVVYSQYIKSKLQVKAKAYWGENMSDHLMLSGYGVSGTSSTTGNKTFTNFNIITSWLNVVYGEKWQVGAFVGLSQNLGTNKDLKADILGNYTAYGFGVYNASQLLLDKLYRVTPHVSYNLPNMKFGIEYDLTSATYGKMTQTGRVSNPYMVNNHRAVASVSYFF